MPVAPTYPGVYIEEIPSGVHTITGVATSITAFIGFTGQGPVNEPVHIFSFADFERAFGGLSVESPLSYAVQQFFQNGGSEAYVVRVAHQAAAAAVTLKNANYQGANVLGITASSAGTWGNALQIDVDYDTADPANLFNLIVTQFVDQNGAMVPGQVETYRNLSMNSLDPNYVVTTVNGGSKLITVQRASINWGNTGGSASSATLAPADVNKLDSTNADPAKRVNRIAVSINGDGPFEFDINQLGTAATSGNMGTSLAAIAGDVRAGILAQSGATVTFPGSLTNQLTFTSQIDSAHPAEQSGIHFFKASRNDATGVLKLGVANGGAEVETQAAFRPEQTSTVGATPTITFPPAAAATGTVNVQLFRGAASSGLKPPMPLTLWGGTTPAPTSLSDLLAQLNTALKAAANTEPLLTGATASLIGGAYRIRLGDADPTLSLEVTQVTQGGNTDTTAGLMGLYDSGTNSVYRNVARYEPGGVTARAQVVNAGTDVGNNGTAPLAGELSGSEAAKTGIYALEKVDLFNLLVMPDSAVSSAVVMEAIAYCKRRRAFMIVDAPDEVQTFADAVQWMQSLPSGMSDSNAALYFPRLRAPDPKRNYTIQPVRAAGAIAGLYARTDADRGVWKAPAGTAASVVGATGLTVTLTDKENGALNPKGLNCLRTFPVYGSVVWGARTARGADAFADEYKYVPVRRLALFLEESLYRGTQWAVFEPNDEPLWAQIRLNLGAFMHSLYAQGAFQGQTPRDAYFVKCDKETTPQNDIDLGRVNIVVGFAPLKPAEFVIIKIQQIAGQIQV